MAEKIKPTRPELKRQRDLLTRFSRYLPMLTLKQQQLQVSLGTVQRALHQSLVKLRTEREAFELHKTVLDEPAGVDVRALAEPTEVRSRSINVAGVRVPVFDEAVFQVPSYSVFATPAWVDRVLLELRAINRTAAEAKLLREQQQILAAELLKVVQRVNLFEKVKIPEAKEAIRRIRIHLGDEMAAGVGRAKMAKARLAHEGATAPEADLEDEAVAP